MGFHEIKFEELNINPSVLFSKDWTLITAEKEGVVNTMAASWGTLGYGWGKNIVMVYIRPQRYTKEFVDANDRFSITVLPEEYRDKVTYLGTVSGRDEDKIQKAGLNITYESKVPYFEESKLVFICKKIYTPTVRPEDFLDANVPANTYPINDYHTLYFAEIEKVLVKTEES